MYVWDIVKVLIYIWPIWSTLVQRDLTDVALFSPIPFK